MKWKNTVSGAQTDRPETAGSANSLLRGCELAFRFTSSTQIQPGDRQTSQTLLLLIRLLGSPHGQIGTLEQRGCLGSEAKDCWSR